ncbi:MAG: RDD family protein [Burkholderiales bacterium]|nr:RDD family protein [Burkholderiales bacterium]
MDWADLCITTWLLVDYVCFFALTFLIGFFIALVFGPDSLGKEHELAMNLMSYLLFFAYYVFFESIWGRTPGKFVCGTKVVTDDGEAPSTGTILKRSLCRFIPFEPLSFFGQRGWHDSISKTRVVTVR